VARGELSAADAQHDWQCWLAISDFFAGPADYKLPRLANLTWADLDRAARLALLRRQNARAENTRPELAGPLGDRRDAVAAIAWRLERRASFFAKLNSDLKAAAVKRRSKMERAAA
jgi:hypothetical protein